MKRRLQRLNEGSVVRHLLGGLIALLFFIFTAFSQEGSTGIPPNESKTLGQKLPNVRLIDTQGREFHLYDLEGKPVILSPIYTNCTSACPIITDSLKKVIPKLGIPGKDFWVLSLTFDPTDGLTNIKDFQKKHGIDGYGWKVVMAKNKKDLFELLDAIDFRFMSVPESKDFVHPNLIVFISPDMKIKRYLYGVVFKEEDMEKALGYALGKESFIDKLYRWFFFIGLIGTAGSGLFMVIKLSKYLARKEELRASKTQP